MLTAPIDTLGIDSGDRYRHVPAEMKARRQWVVWRKVERKPKATKVPYQAKSTRKEASSTDPETWASFAEAVAAKAADPTIDGIGYVFSSDDPFCGIDFDDCLDDDGEILPWAARRLEALGGYQDFSPGGRGVKVVVRATMPGGKGRKVGGQGPDGKGAVEAYSRARYFTITGDAMTIVATIPDAQKAVDALLSEVFPPAVEPRKRGKVRVIPLLPDDDVLLDKARNAANGPKFRALFDRGDISGYPPSQGRENASSEADLALASMLAFWIGNDPERIDRLFRQSALMAPKWDEMRGEGTYGERTIDRALNRDATYGDNAGGAKEAKKAEKGSGGGASFANSASFASAPSEHETEDEPVIARTWPGPPDELAFAGPLGALVDRVMPFTEADRTGVLMQSLIAFGNAIGRRPHWVAGATTHRLNLFACTVGPTAAGRKGTAWDLAKMVLSACDESFVRGCIKSGLSSGEGLIWEVRDAIYKQEPIKEKGRVTGYQQVMVDEGVTDKRLLVVETEFGGTLKVLGREGNSLSARMREAWDDGNLRALTKNNQARATDAHISIIGHVTEFEVNKHLTKNDAANGFANRFLWLCVRRSKSLPKGQAIHAEMLNGYLGAILNAFTFARDLDRPIGRDAEAERLWEHEYNTHLAAEKPGLLGSVLSRAAPQVMRMACLYAILEQSDVVMEHHLRSALAMWDYCERSCAYIFGDYLGDDDAEKVLSALRLAPDGLSQTDISVEVFHKHKSRREIARILGRLVEQGFLRSESVATAGRPATVWRVADAKEAKEAN